MDFVPENVSADFKFRKDILTIQDFKQSLIRRAKREKRMIGITSYNLFASFGAIWFEN